jgi:uncharacterized protein YbcI
MPARAASEHPSDGGPLGAAVSNVIVRLLAEYTGRGPTKARTTIRGNVVLVVLQDTLTKGERALVAKDRAPKVLELRSEFQAAMREEAVEAVEQLVDRKVIAFMSANHIDPDLAAEVFVLEGEPVFDTPEISAAPEV